MITNLAVQRGNVTDLDLVESFWIRLELTTINGSTLRYLGRR